MLEDKNFCRFFILATTNKIYVNGLNSHESKIEVSLDYTSAFGVIGPMLVGEIEQKTNIRFKNVEDFETHIITIDVENDSEGVIFTGWL